jgi:ABC-type Fe3+-siderophore transport system permease subunit
LKFEQPDPFQQTIARTFTYATSAFLIGAMFYLFTNNLISLTYRPDLLGTFILVAYGFVFGNITYLVTRRYVRKPYTFEPFSWLIGLIVVFPTLFLIRLKGDVFPVFQDELIYSAVILLGTAAGTWKGREKGKKMLADLEQGKQTR